MNTLLSLEPKESDYIVSEAVSNGFSVRVYPSGVKTFVFRKRTDKGVSRTAIDRIENISINEARLKAVNLGATLRVNNLEEIELKHEKNSTIYQLNELYKSYDWSRLGVNSKTEYQRYLDKLTNEKSFLFIQSLSKRSILKSYLDEIARDKPVTANRTKAAISKFINFLVDADLLPENVSHPMKKYPEKPRKRSLDAPQELSALSLQFNR